jgi:preprotein translocase subunit SecD
MRATTVLALVFLPLLAVVYPVALTSGSTSIALVAEWTLVPCAEATPAQLDATSRILRTRLAVWGIPSTVEASSSAIIVKLAACSHDETARLCRVVTAHGGFALHDMAEAQIGRSVPPPGFEKPRWAKASRRGTMEFVHHRPFFTATPSEPPSVSSPDYESASPRVHIPLAAEDQERLGNLTERRIGRRVGVVIDGHLWGAPLMQHRFTGDLAIPVDTTQNEARVLATFVSAPPVDLCLTIKSERAIYEAYEEDVRSAH